jgi:hypothetical protein
MAATSYAAFGFLQAELDSNSPILGAITFAINGLGQSTVENNQ